MTHHLQSGKSIHTGTSPKELLDQRKKQQKEQISAIIGDAFENSIAHAAHLFSLSETAVVKLCISRAKRDELNLSLLMNPEKQERIKEFILESHTSSIKKLLHLAQGTFSEGEIRLVRYLLQQQDTPSWDF